MPEFRQRFRRPVCRRHSGRSAVRLLWSSQRGRSEERATWQALQATLRLRWLHNAINTGAVEGTDYVSGIIGKTGFGSVALNHNYGNISASGSHTAGILGLGGNNTIIHYCGNFGDISNPSGKYIGGIVGEIGDPRKWTAMNIAECVVGSIEIIMSVASSVHSRGGARCWLGVPYGRHGDQDFGIRFRPCPKCHGCRLMVDRGCRAGLPRDP